MKTQLKMANRSPGYAWVGHIAVAALLAGCTGEIDYGDRSNTTLPPSSATTGNAVDANGNPVDPGNTAVDPNGNPVDANGNPVDPNATPVDANGNPTDPNAAVDPNDPGANPVATPVNCTPGIAPTSQIPRLTNDQYDRTIRDLLGVTGLAASGNAVPSTLLATDQAGGLSDLGWSAYKSVADMIAQQVMADATLQANFIKCDLATGGDTCLHDTIVEFGRRAFRRPLTDVEVASFERLISKGTEAAATPQEVAEAILYTFLVSPSFIQRSEISETPDANGNYVLSSYEIASRLSYMLWGTMPDEELLQAADQGLLSTPDQILSEANRMLQDPRARDMVTDFHRYYLLMGPGGRWDTAQRDATLFPSFSADLIPVMSEETLRFFDSVAFTGGGFQDFFLSSTAFVNNLTAPLYGLDPAQFGSDLQQVELDPMLRPGFLTRLGFLISYSSYTRTSPILRGAFITKQVLGIHIDPPPPGAAQTALPDTADLDTNRKQVDAQTSPPECAGCHHAYVNPPGFVMEAYDTIGAWQTNEASTGAPIDTVADVVVNDGDAAVAVTGPFDLMSRIATSPGAMKQYAGKWVSYAYEREADPLDACTVDQLAAKMTAGGYTVLNLVADLTQTESFRTRALEVTP